jgi:hypothetical protein
MPPEPTGGVKGSKPRLKIAKEEIPQLSREYLIHRNEQMRNKNLTAQMELAVRREQLTSKDLVTRQATWLLTCLRQRLLNLPSHAHKLVGLDANAMRNALKEIALSTLNELKNAATLTDIPDKTLLLAIESWETVAPLVDELRAQEAAA